LEGHTVLPLSVANPVPILTSLRPQSSARRSLRRAGVAAVLVTAALAGLPGPVPPASGQAPPPAIGEPVRDGDGPVVWDPRVDPQLAAVPVVGSEVAEAHNRFRQDQRAHQAAQADEAAAVRELDALAAARVRLDAAVNQSTRRHEKSSRELAELRRSIGAIAIEDYMAGKSMWPLELDADVEAATQNRGRRVVSASVRGRLLDDAQAHAAVVEVSALEMTSARAELEDVVARQGEQTAARDEAVGRQVRLAQVLEADARAVGDARLRSGVRGADFPLLALNAYHRAARRLAGEQPACRIHWSLLAGIGKTESGHGTFRGSSLDITGSVTIPIIGIPLDGTNGTARITDTDRGAMDGDRVYDRAVGPMQFIPSTWARWGRDGDGDGRANPQNLYDAALTAAAYLCDAGPGLDTDGPRRTAVLRYNQSEAYVSTVVSRARGYEQLRLA
jgi:membrane-bound lytic murein transglycosylase B